MKNVFGLYKAKFPFWDICIYPENDQLNEGYQLTNFFRFSWLDLMMQFPTRGMMQMMSSIIYFIIFSLIYKFIIFLQSLFSIKKTQYQIKSHYFQIYIIKKINIILLSNKLKNKIFKIFYFD